MNEREASEQIDALERERAEDIATAHSALAAAQDRSYWLDRWGLDLNALMRKPSAGLIRAALRAVRVGYRTAYDARSESRRRVKALRGRLDAARSRVDRERADSAASATAQASGDGQLPDAVLRLLGETRPELVEHARVAVTLPASADEASERLAALHAELLTGSAVVVSAADGGPAPAWLAEADWQMALYLAGGLEVGRDLYVLERR